MTVAVMMEYSRRLWADMRPNDYHPLIREVIGYISDNYFHINSIPEIAAEVGANYHTLRDRFSRETRITLESFLIRTRLNAALSKLDKKNKLIKQIAWDVGFKYEDQLTRAFRKYLNTTPQMVRVQYGLNQGIHQALKNLKG